MGGSSGFPSSTPCSCRFFKAVPCEMRSCSALDFSLTCYTCVIHHLCAQPFLMTWHVQVACVSALLRPYAFMLPN